MLFRFIGIFLLLLLIDWYFFQSVKTITTDWPEPRQKLVFYAYWVFSASLLALGILLLLTYQQGILPKWFTLYALSFIMVVLVSKIIGSLFLAADDMSRLVQRLTKPGLIGNSGGEPITRAAFLSYTAAGLALIPFGSFIYGMVVTAFDFKVRRVIVPIASLPAGFEGLKIIQISDLHSGSFVSDEPFRRAVEMIQQEQADMIVFTGDLVNDRASEAEPFIDIWKELNAPLGVYSILGNHDYGDYITWESKQEKAANLERLKQIHREMNWDLLLNEHRIIERKGERIALLGVENWGEALRFPKIGDVQKAKEGLPDIPVKILLSHDPSHWDAQIRKQHTDIDLMLAGHTHGFQFGIEIPGFKWSPSQWIYKQWAGLYNVGKQYIYVNRGLGFIGYMGRVGIKPEITVLELTAKV